MKSNGIEASQIQQEIESLKADKLRIEQRISELEAQLRRLNTSDETNQTDVVRDAPICFPPISNGKLSSGHGLSPENIYRYSRHLLLPSFGVQGLF